MRLILASLMVMLPATAFAADGDGAKIYKLKCANCHGATGEGSKKYDKRLEGDRSVAQLAKVVLDTMPESNPGSLSEAEAKAVAAYIHDAFYSAVARERNRPARVELARLTVRQYRQSVADVIGGFRRPMTWTAAGGLKAQYYAGRRLGGNAALERVDPQVGFDFKTESPVPGKIEPHEFSIRWNGSLLAPETGEYEFTVRSDHAIRLWFNNQSVPLIDAWVKSGSDTEFKGSLYLIGGRVYPLRLEFTKAKQGVDDSKNRKTKPPSKPASISLLWKRPGRVAEVVPSRHLSPNGAPESYVCSVAFPPDDRSYGWERGTTVSREWDAAATEAALDVAAYVVSRLDELTGTRPAERTPRPNSGNPADLNPDKPAAPKATDADKKLRAFARSFTERAFRRPLAPDQQALIDKQFAATADPEIAIKRVVLLALKSPRFLYREPGASDESFAVASRLSYGLWDSIPDAELLRAAGAGQLATREQIARQAERMLNDPRAKTKLRDFLLTWVKADHGLDLAKDAKKFPGFDAGIIADLRTSLELFLDDVVWSESSDFRRLLADEDVFINARLAKFYGIAAPAGGEFVKVKLESGKRAGVLTHPYLMTSFAHSGESSPIHRGVFLARGVLGLSLRPPPEAVAPLAPDLHPSLTTRERVTLQTKPNVCMTCHAVINPLGFTLEHFDAVGRYREKELGKAIDATGSYGTRDGRVVKVNGAVELARFLAGSDEAHEAFVEQLFHHLVQQPVRAYGPKALDELRTAFTTSGFNIRRLAVEALATSARVDRMPGKNRAAP